MASAGGTSLGGCSSESACSFARGKAKAPKPVKFRPLVLWFGWPRCCTWSWASSASDREGLAFSPLEQAWSFGCTAKWSVAMASWCWPVHCPVCRQHTATHYCFWWTILWASKSFLGKIASCWAWLVPCKHSKSQTSGFAHSGFCCGSWTLHSGPWLLCSGLSTFDAWSLRDHPLSSFAWSWISCSWRFCSPLTGAHWSCSCRWVSRISFWLIPWGSSSATAMADKYRTWMLLMALAPWSS